MNINNLHCALGLWNGNFDNVQVKWKEVVASQCAPMNCSMKCWRCWTLEPGSGGNVHSGFEYQTHLHVLLHNSRFTTQWIFMAFFQREFDMCASHFAWLSVVWYFSSECCFAISRGLSLDFFSLVLKTIKIVQWPGLTALVRNDKS